MSAPQPSSPPPRPAGFLQVIGTVLSAFVGIRKGPPAGQAPVVIKPVHIVAAGVLCALVFIATLVTVVRLIIA